MTTQQNRQGIRDVIGVIIAKHGLTIESVFVPWSLSRNAGEKSPSLNWRVTLKQEGRNILTTDYSAGCGHAPSYQQRETVDSHANVLRECEKGFATYGSMGMLNTKKPITPEARDVIYSLLLDSDALDHDSFESWASDFGYDTDSREAEKTYQACLKIALQFRKIGEAAIVELRDAFQDY